MKLVLFTDFEHHPGASELLAATCARAATGTVCVILRDRSLSARERLRLGQSLREVTRATGQLLVVADRVDLALCLEADGVHLPSQGLLPSEVTGLGEFSWISRAHHDASSLGVGELRMLTHLVVSPVWAERKGRAPLGAQGLGRRVAELRRLVSGVQILGLGGVTAALTQDTLAAGADGVCVLGGIHRPGEPAALLEALEIERAPVR